MLSPSQLQLNRIAQELVSSAEGTSWFESLQADSRISVLRELAFMCGQAHPTADDVPTAIERARLKPTFTPCVLLLRAATPEKALHRLLELPEQEHARSFSLMMALFAIADARRRESSCRNGCSHEWHNLPAL